MRDKMKELSYFSNKLLPWVIICLGITIRFVQYLYNRSLWWDEAALALNVIKKTYLELLGSLDFNQAAPAAFVLVTKLMVQVFGSSEYILRLIPFLSGIVSLLLFFKIAKSFLKPRAILIALSLFAISEPLIRYSTEFKQYSIDVVVVLLLYLTTIHIESAIQSKILAAQHIVLFGLLGATVIWFSYASVFVLAGVGVSLTLTWSNRKNWSVTGILLIVCSLWTLSFLVYYFIHLRNIVGNEYLLNFWSARVPFWGVPQGGAFMPLPLSLSVSAIKRFVNWLILTFFRIFRNPGGIYLEGIAGLALIIGSAEIFVKKKRTFFILTSPILITLLSSGFERYPFYERMLLFTAPAILILIGAGAEQVICKIWHRSTIIGIVFIGLLFLHPCLSVSGYLVKPYTLVEIKPALNYIKKHRQVGDTLYVSYGAEPLIRYYSERYGLNDSDYVIGVGSPFVARSINSWENYKNDLNKLRDYKRVWVLISYIPNDEKKFFLYLLGTLGVRLDSFHSPGVAVYLYELDKTAKRRNAF